MVSRASGRLLAFTDTSRSLIRVLMLVLVLFGLILIFNEILEQTVLCDVGACGKVHLSPMGWGLAFIVLGCLVIQKGDMSLSLKEFGDFGDRVVSWRKPFGRRAYDAEAPKEVCDPKDAAPAPPTFPGDRHPEQDD